MPVQAPHTGHARLAPAAQDDQPQRLIPNSPVSAQPTLPTRQAPAGLSTMRTVNAMPGS